MTLSLLPNLRLPCLLTKSLPLVIDVVVCIVHVVLQKIGTSVKEAHLTTGETREHKSNIKAPQKQCRPLALYQSSYKKKPQSGIKLPDHHTSCYKWI